MKQKPKRTPVRTTVHAADSDIADSNVLSRLASGKISGSEIAKLAGISVARACKLLREGHTPLSIVMKRRMPARAPGRASGHAAGMDGRTHAELTRERLAVDISRRKFELSLREGTVMRLGDVKIIVALIQSILIAFKQQLFILPTELADALAGLEAGEIRARLDEELCRLLAKVRAECDQVLERHGLKMQEGE